MVSISCDGKIKFKLVAKAMETCGISVRPNDPQAVLVWFDSLKKSDFFSKLKPWQVVNRIPNMSVLCKKAPFVRCIQRMSNFFPNLFQFLPKSFILPVEMDRFNAFQAASVGKRFIIKPSNGSLGKNIQIIEAMARFRQEISFSVAQEYIDSYLIDGFKFDFRIYALVIIGETPKIYVYRDGLARFCSEKAAEASRFSQITNTAVNIKNPAVTAATITKTVSEVMRIIGSSGGDVDRIWSDIDSIVGLTVLSGAGFLCGGASERCPSVGYERCFQLLGFDVLLDRNLKPWILEVNFRPSLEFDVPEERDLKTEMLTSLLKIAAPYQLIEEMVRENGEDFNLNGWRAFCAGRTDLIEKAKNARKGQNGKFKKIFPSDDPRKSEWKRVLEVSNLMPKDYGFGFQLPRIIYSIPEQKVKAKEMKRVSHLPSLTQSMRASKNGL